MTARVALSSGSRSAQYVGTTRVGSSGGVNGSSTARLFNGAGDRIILARSDEIGESFTLGITFWRSNTNTVIDNKVAARLFTQYGVGVTRIGVGINRTKLAVTYTTPGGTQVTVETEVELITTAPQHLILEVSPTQIEVLLNGYRALLLTAALCLPGKAMATVCSDTASRYFAGGIDDLVIYPQPPADLSNWTRYYLALTRTSYTRDFTPSPLHEGYAGASLMAGGMSAQGSEDLSRVRTEYPFRANPELGVQVVEIQFELSAGLEGFRLGIVNSSHDMVASQPGDSPDSWAYTSGGQVINDSLVSNDSIPILREGDKLALSFDPDTRRTALLVSGVEVHSFTAAPGTWYPAATIGKRMVKFNTGIDVAKVSTLPARPGVYSAVSSRLTTELHHMKAGEVSCALDDADTFVRDQAGTVVGVYYGTAVLDGGLTGDSFDVSRKVGGGIKLNSSSNLVAGLNFFFSICFSPEASDLVGDHVLFQSSDKFLLKLIDGRLFASVGSIQVGSIDPAFEAGKRYIVGITRSPGGKLMVWCHLGFILQSGDTTVAQVSDEVWIGSAPGGVTEVFAGKLSHFIGATTQPALWKRDRLAKAHAWDDPILIGLLPAPIQIRRVFEPSYRDLLEAGIDSTPSATENYVAAVAADPDEVSTEFKIVQRTGGNAYAGSGINTWAVSGVITTEIGPEDRLLTFGPGVVENLATVSAGSAALIGNEIVRVASVSTVDGTVYVDRACVDTVPARHVTGTRVFFYQGRLGFNVVPYVAGTAVDVKLLSRNALAEMSEDQAPVDTVTAAQRSVRPYPPADVLINGYSAPMLLTGTLSVTWKHRNAVTQGTALRSWKEASVTAPTELTYVVRAFNATDSSLLYESSVLSSTTSAYDLFVDGYTGPLLVNVTSYKDGLPCLYVPAIELEYDFEVIAYLATEDGEAIDAELDEDGNLLAEEITTLMAGSPTGQLPDDFSGIDGEAEEEEEEEELGSTIIGIRISDMPLYPQELVGSELIPIVRDGQNYYVTPNQLLSFVIPQLPEPANGESAYQIAVRLGYTGTEAQWVASLEGPSGPSSNASRRILSIGAASGAVVCNWALYDEIRLTLAGNVTLSFTGAKDGQGCLLKVRQDATGSRTVTLPGNIRFNNLIQGYIPSAGPGMVDKVGFVYDSSESSYDFVSWVPGLTS